MQTLWSNTAWYPFLGSQISRFKGIFLQLKQVWETQRMVHRVIGKGFSKAPHFWSAGAWVRHSSHFTNNLPTWIISTYNHLFRTICNLSGGWTGRGRTNERLGLGVWKGTCHSNFQLGRRINQRLSLIPGTRIETEAILRVCGQLPEERFGKWSSGARQFTNLQSYKW